MATASRRTQLMLEATIATAHLVYEDQAEILRAIFIRRVGNRLVQGGGPPPVTYSTEEQIGRDLELIRDLLTGLLRRPLEEQGEVLKRVFLGHCPAQ